MTTPYANTAIQTNQVALSAGVATKVGSGTSGVPLANRLMWRGLSIDTAAQVYIGSSAVTVGIGYALQTGIPEERAMGASIDIWAISATTTTIYVEEIS